MSLSFMGLQFRSPPIDAQGFIDLAEPGSPIKIAGLRYNTWGIIAEQLYGLRDHQEK